MNPRVYTAVMQGTNSFITYHKSTGGKYLVNERSKIG